MVIVQIASPEGKMIVVAQKANSLAHTKLYCKHFIVYVILTTFYLLIWPFPEAPDYQIRKSNVVKRKGIAG